MLQETDFRLVPYVAVEPIFFGMSGSDVEQLLGKPHAVTINTRGERDEQRGSISVRYAVGDGGVVEVAFIPGVKVSYEGCNLFEVNDVVAFLSRYDEELYEFVGFLISLKLGVTLTGFHDKDGSQKAITVFDRGRWDAHRAQFQVFQRVGSK